MVHCFHLYPHFVWLKSAPATKVLGASHIKAQYWSIEGVQAGPRRPRCAPLEFAARASVDPLSILTKFNFGGKQWIQGLNLKAWQPLSSLHHIDLSFLIWTTQTRQSLSSVSTSISQPLISNFLHYLSHRRPLTTSEWLELDNLFQPVIHHFKHPR